MCLGSGRRWRACNKSGTHERARAAGLACAAFRICTVYAAPRPHARVAVAERTLARHADRRQFGEILIQFKIWDCQKTDAEKCSYCIKALSHRNHVHTHKPATAQPGEPPTAPQARRGKAAQRKLYLRARITARRWVRYVGCQAPDLTHPPVGGHLSPVPAPSDTARTHPPQKFESTRRTAAGRPRAMRRHRPQTTLPRPRLRTWPRAAPGRGSRPKDCSRHSGCRPRRQRGLPTSHSGWRPAAAAEFT